MDKLLLSMSLALLLATLTVNSAPMPDSKLISSVDQRQKKQSSHSTLNNDDEDSTRAESVEADRMQRVNQLNEDASDDDDDNDQRRPRVFSRRRNDLLGEAGLRQHKMIGFNPFNAFPFGYPSFPAQAFYPAQFYEDFNSFYGGYGADDDEVMSRHNPGNRRRQPTYKNSPIFYIRLPPTPYMFVPGLGYISQPPSYAPMTPVPQPISPFYNLPLDFISNGKPTNIYQWGSPASQFPQQPQFPQQQQFVQQSPQFGSYPTYQRPQRPYNQRPVNPFLQESKVTNLKGQFVFNGRPEEIFLLPNSYNSIYPDPRLSAAFY